MTKHELLSAISLGLSTVALLFSLAATMTAQEARWASLDPIGQAMRQFFGDFGR